MEWAYIVGGFIGGICVAVIVFIAYCRHPVYQHFKGDYYSYLGEAHNSEKWDEMWVVYQSHKHHHWVVRPKAMFFEDIDKPEYKGPRFKRV